MQQIWFEEVKYDLEMMERNMARDFRMKAGHVLEFAPIEIDKYDDVIRPTLVVLVTRMFSGNRAKAINMSAVIQFIHYATVIHNNIKDNEDKFKPQLPVLVGDYLYSKFFSYLSKYDSLEYLAPLSQVICDIHTGGIVRKEVIEKGQGTTVEQYQTLKREHGLLMGEACKMAASLSEASKAQQELAYKFGVNVGIAWGALKERAMSVFVHEALAKATAILKELPAGEAKEALDSLLQELANHTAPVELQSNLA